MPPAASGRRRVLALTTKIKAAAPKQGVAAFAFPYVLYGG